MQKFQASLNGVNFRPAETRQIVADLPIDTKLALEREPTNPYDSNAIRVLLDIGAGEEPEFLGFVDKSVAEDLAPFMDQGIRFEATILSFLGTIKPFLEIEEMEDEEAAEQEEENPGDFDETYTGEDEID